MKTIPVIDVPYDKEVGIVTALEYPNELNILLKTAAKTYTTLGLNIADYISEKLSKKLASPYSKYLQNINEIINQPGTYLLNYSYEWGCTSGIIKDDAGLTLLRTLDWPFDKLSQAIIVVKQQNPIGDYLNITFPGSVGILTGLAKGRFAISINQPPLPNFGLICGWMLNRLRVNNSTSIPPSHLVRYVFDTCKTYDDAIHILKTTPVCMPVIFTVAGLQEHENITIERLPHSFRVANRPIAANHWTTDITVGKPRNKSSIYRFDKMKSLIENKISWNFDWVSGPIFCNDTRLSAMMNPTTGKLLLQGWEKTGKSTEILEIS